MKLLNKYQPSPNDSWVWNLATYFDIDDMFLMAKEHFEKEIDTILTINDFAYKYALDIATTHQRHNLGYEQLLTCRDKNTNKLLAYSWIGRGHRTSYSSDEMAEGKMAHLDLNLNGHQRIHILVQMIHHWENWTRSLGIPVLISTSIRQDQAAFLRLHERLGFIIRGGLAYKRLINKEII